MMDRSNIKTPLRFSDIIAAIRLRKLLFFVLCFALSMYTGQGTNKEFKLLLGALAFALSVGFLLYHRLSAPWKRLPLLSLLPITLGLLFGQLQAYRYFDGYCANILSYDGQSATVKGVVEEVTYSEPYASCFTFRVTSIGAETVDFPVVLELPFACDAEENDILSLHVTFSRPEMDRYGFEANDYYASHGIFLIANAEEDKPVTFHGTDSSLSAFFHELSATLETRLVRTLGKDSGSLSSALLLGRKENMSDALTRDFRFLGLSHTLAISGLHLSILVGGLLYLLYAVRMPKIPVFLLTVTFILGYMALTGFSPSVVRAGIMYILLLFSQLTSLRYDAPTGLAAAVFVILLISPGAILDPGFLLSVAATAGLIALGIPLSNRIQKRFRKSKKPLRYLSKLLSSMALTYSALLFTLPFAWIYFKELAPISLITNILFLPLIRIYLFLSALTLLLYGLPFVGLIADITVAVSNLISSFASLCTRFSLEPISLRYPFTATALLVGAASLLLLLILKRSRFTAFFLSCAMMVFTFGIGLFFHRHTLRHEDTVVAVTIGQNDYLLLHSGGHTLLCDFSDGSSSHLSSAASLAARHCYDTSLDTLLLTHLHRKHISAFSRLADRHRLRQLILPSPQTEKEAMFASSLIEEANARGIEVILFSPTKSEVLLFDDCKLRLEPLRYLDRSVQPIHLLRIEGESTFTYLGSSFAEVFPLPSDGLLWLGTHGPNIKSPIPNGLDPKQTLVSSEEVNRDYGTDFSVIDGYYRIFTLTS